MSRTNGQIPPPDDPGASFVTLDDATLMAGNIHTLAQSLGFKAAQAVAGCLVAYFWAVRAERVMEPERLTAFLRGANDILFPLASERATGQWVPGRDAERLESFRQRFQAIHPITQGRCMFCGVSCPDDPVHPPDPDCLWLEVHDATETGTNASLQRISRKDA